MVDADSSVYRQPSGENDPPVSGRGRKALARIAALVVGILTFVIALELLKRGAAGYSQGIFGVLRAGTPAAALGLGWVLAYLFLSGSPVAALAVSLFAARTLDAPQTLMMITGSRLGASLVVLVAGLLYAARGHHSRDGVAVGVLAMLTTAVIYLPAMLLAYWLLASGRIPVADIDAPAPLASVLDPFVDPVVGLLAAHLLPWALIIAGVATLLLAFALIDRALPEIHHESRALRRVDRMARSPLAMFLLGAAITSVTLSVSVSVSALVPLAARGLVRRARAVPYIMGANITTFVDTLVAALITGGPAAFTIVLVEMISVATVSLLVLLLAYHPLERVLLHLQEGVMRDWRATLVFVAVLVCVPLGLLAL